MDWITQHTDLIPGERYYLRTKNRRGPMILGDLIDDKPEPYFHDFVRSSEAVKRWDIFGPIKDD